MPPSSRDRKPVLAVPYGPVLKGLVSLQAATLTLGSLAWAADLYRRVGIVLFNEQHLSMALAVALPMLYLSVPLRKGEPRRWVPWYDLLAAVAGSATALYITARYPQLLNSIIGVPTGGVVVSSIMVVLCLEGLRRTVGKTLLIFTLLLFAYAQVGHLVPGALQTKRVTLDKLVLYVGLDPSGLLGVVMLIAATIVVGFVFFGQVLQKSGGADFFNDLALALMGRFRGGSAKIAVTASSLFGSITGIVVSNIMATGSMTIPMMRRAGYTPHSAAAIESVASTGGQLMPPVMGAVAFFMAERLEVPYASVALAALIPALLYYVALFVQADLEAARDGIKALNRSEIPSLWDVLARGWTLLVPFAVIIVGLFVMNLQPEVAALYGSLTGIAAGVVFGYRTGRMSLRSIVTAVTATGRGVLEIFMIAAAAGFIIGIMNRTGLGFGLTILLVQAASEHLFLLLGIAAVMCIVLGMGMPTLAVYLLLSVVVAPSIIEAGVEPMAAHLFILYFGMMSMITPPLAIASYFAASLAEASAIKTALASMRFGWLAYVVPFLFVVHPSLLMRGDVGTIVLNLATAIGGILLVSVTMIGYLFRPVSLWARAAFAACGVMLVAPVNLVTGAIMVNILGLVLGVALVTVEWRATPAPASQQGPA